MVVLVCSNPVEEIVRGRIGRARHDDGRIRRNVFRPRADCRRSKLSLPCSWGSTNKNEAVLPSEEESPGLRAIEA